MSARRGMRRFGAVVLGFAAAIAHVAGAEETAPAAALPLRVLLVGDSTMAPETGYGDALCGRFLAGVNCLNLAKGGRSSASYRAEGSWQRVQTLLQDGARYRATYVLIQFGHNDQPGKPGRSTDLQTEFPQNMAGYAREVKAAGAIPVLVTPLVRRTFHGAELDNDLQAWADATRRVAAAEKIPLLDLNADSAKVVQTMGPAAADTLAMAPPEPAPPAAAPPKERGNGYRGFDHTHLGAKGAALFARVIEQELVAVLPSTTTDFKKEE